MAPCAGPDAFKFATLVLAMERSLHGRLPGHPPPSGALFLELPHILLPAASSVFRLGSPSPHHYGLSLFSVSRLFWK